MWPNFEILGPFITFERIEPSASNLVDIDAVLKVVQERSPVSPVIRGRAPPPKILIYFWSENGEFWYIIGGILCDLELQESKQETRCRPGKSKGAGSPTRPHFKPCIDGGPLLRADHKTTPKWA